jgi:hypothetical protein
MTRREKPNNKPHQFLRSKQEVLYFDQQELDRDISEPHAASRRAVVLARDDLSRVSIVRRKAVAFGEVLHFEWSWSCLAAVAAVSGGLLRVSFAFGLPTRAIGEGLPDRTERRESIDVQKRYEEPGVSKTPKLSRRISGPDSPFVHQPEFEE